jgi:hypothetical protein
LSGHFAIPLYKGEIKEDVLDELKNSETPQLALKKLRTSGKIKLLNETSLVIKVVDNQLKHQYNDYFENYNIKTSYLDPDLKKSHAYKKIQGGFFSSPKPISDQVPTNTTKEAFTKLFKKKLFEYLDIEGYVDPDEAKAKDKDKANDTESRLETDEEFK